MYEVFEMLCQQKGVTVAEVSRSTGISQSTLSNWKKRRNNLSAENAKKIADYFGVTVGFLMGVQENVQKAKEARKVPGMPKCSMMGIEQ